MVRLHSDQRLDKTGSYFFICLFEISLKFSAGLISLWCGKWHLTSLGQARGSLWLLWPNLSHLTLLPCTFEVLAINKFLLCNPPETFVFILQYRHPPCRLWLIYLASQDNQWLLLPKYYISHWIIIICLESAFPSKMLSPYEED